MISKSPSTATATDYLDKIHVKIKGIEQGLKGFKLKSRAAYESLVDEEQILASEVEMWAAKFESYSQEKSAVSDILLGSKKPTVSTGLRSSSVGNRN